MIFLKTLYSSFLQKGDVAWQGSSLRETRARVFGGRGSLMTMGKRAAMGQYATGSFSFSSSIQHDTRSGFMQNSILIHSETTSSDCRANLSAIDRTRQGGREGGTKHDCEALQRKYVPSSSSFSYFDTVSFVPVTHKVVVCGKGQTPAFYEQKPRGSILQPPRLRLQTLLPRGGKDDTGTAMPDEISSALETKVEDTNKIRVGVDSGEHWWGD
ncbi:hypothetical protein F5I97DRAFT_1867880 [Phlebopus sp. FC_14]|nr:hypothetical protein F5I97DRAFT_1867880 [Phlebopus sp. FC_14]